MSAASSRKCLSARLTFNRAPGKRLNMRRRMEARCPRSPATSWPARASRARPRRAAWRFPYPSTPSFSACSTGLSGSRLRSLHHDPVEESADHPEAGSLPVVVAERVLVQVRLQVLRRDRVVRPADPALHGRPEPLDGVRVDVPAHVDTLRVVDAGVLVAHAFERVVGLEVV